MNEVKRAADGLMTMTSDFKGKMINLICPPVKGHLSAFLKAVIRMGKTDTGFGTKRCKCQGKCANNVLEKRG